MEGTFQFKNHQKVYLVIKRILDIFLSGLLILLGAVPMAVVAIVTRCTSKGPALFKQKRLGKDEVPFTMLKFRSMRADAPQVATCELPPSEAKKYVTKWGRFMRSTSIDELPQLFTIFIGKMSFIGPRPCQDEEHERSLVLARRSTNPHAFVVKPGLSGLAQVKLHRDHNPQHKADLDSEYARNLSFWEDFKIFFLSFGVIFNAGGRTQKEPGESK
ncbi:MAG: sugar transferase [Bacilli bacterium]|nr:sugar transferase [Bacilli bacterium]